MFAFKFDKALQATAYLLRREPSKEMNYMRLLKVVYIADRESLRHTGRPITGDRTVAMKQGPVLSQLLNLIKGDDLRSPEWAEFIQRDEYKIRLAKDPGQPSLSRFEIETLERIAEENRSRDEWDMVEYTHTFEEWQANKPSGKSSNPIPLADILKAVERSSDALAIEEDAQADQAFERLFGR